MKPTEWKAIPITYQYIVNRYVYKYFWWKYRVRVEKHFTRPDVVSTW